MAADFAGLIDTCWDEVVGGIKGGVAALSPFRGEWTRAAALGDDLRKIERRMSAALRDPMAWPWRDEWRVRFHDWGVGEPYLWNRPAAAVAAHTVLSRASALRRRRQHQLLAGWTFRLMNGLDPPELEARLLAFVAPRVAAYPAESSALPPFFPGDRTSVRAEPPPRTAP